MSTLYCSECGAEIEADDLFCSECGAKQKQKKTNKTTKKTNKTTKRRKKRSEPLMQVPPLASAEPPSKKSGCLNLFLAVVAAIVAGYIIGAISALIGEKVLVGTFDRDTLDYLKVIAIITALIVMWSIYAMVRASGSTPKLPERPSFPVIRSGIKKYPSAKHVILEVLGLYETHGGEFATFSMSDEEYIQAIVDDSVTLNFSWPYEENPDRVLADEEITLPDGFELTDLEKGTYAMYSGPLLSKNELATTIDTLFQSLYEADDQYRIDGVLE